MQQRRPHSTAQESAELAGKGGGEQQPSFQRVPSIPLKSSRRRRKAFPQEGRFPLVSSLAVGGFAALMLLGFVLLLASSSPSSSSSSSTSTSTSSSSSRTTAMETTSSKGTNDNGGSGDSRQLEAAAEEAEGKDNEKHVDEQIGVKKKPRKKGGLAARFAGRDDDDFVGPDDLEWKGDNSTRYRELRQRYDALLPPDDQRSLEFTALQRQGEYQVMGGGGAVSCPAEPAADYPLDFPAVDVLTHWPPNDVTPRTHIYRGICVLDYQTEYETALRYRNAEKPFVLRGDPAVARVVERWNQPGYLHQMLGDDWHDVEYSKTNQFLYWGLPRQEDYVFDEEGRPILQNQLQNGGVLRKNPQGGPPRIRRGSGGIPPGWRAPTRHLKQTFGEWWDWTESPQGQAATPQDPHYYFRLIGCGTLTGCDPLTSDLLFDELDFFRPKRNSLYTVQPKRQRGIHCRFGARGITAQNHFDGSRNFIVLLGGERRYILTHPNQCQHLNLTPRYHPSERHSTVDLSLDMPELLKKHPSVRDLRINEVVLQAGDALYIPTQWFHYIISLNRNFQCNTRSGASLDYLPLLQKCGY